MGDFEPSGKTNGLSLLEYHITRRRLLALSAMAGAAAVTVSCLPPVEPVSDKKVIPATHLAWVWQFSTDGTPQKLASVLSQNNLGIILKTHNGTEWMGDWDKSSQAVTGPAQVQKLANYFENNNVPFHAYCVLNGVDPTTEAKMCAQVIGAGARSIVIDLEPWAGYWAGTPQTAATFASEFRRQQPNAVVSLCVEPRPWVMPRIPMAQFVSIAQIIAPMIYWETFNTSDNVDDFKGAGYDPGSPGICPEFLLDVSASMFGGYGLPIQPVGQGDSTLDAWVNFLTHAYAIGMGCVSAWRFGVTNTDVSAAAEGKSARFTGGEANAHAITDSRAEVPQRLAGESREHRVLPQRQRRAVRLRQHRRLLDRRNEGDNQGRPRRCRRLPLVAGSDKHRQGLGRRGKRDRRHLA